MLFNFQTFIQELRESNEKKEIVSAYENLYGPITGEITDQKWFKEYCQNFSIVRYNVPNELESDFDWNVLLSLGAASFSSDAILKKSKEKETEFIIRVQQAERIVEKKVSELWGFQILRMYEIFAEEQMNLQILMAEDERQKEGIENQRNRRLQRWETIINPPKEVLITRDSYDEFLTLLEEE